LRCICLPRTVEMEAHATKLEELNIEELIGAWQHIVTACSSLV
jgi:hypothetical protein